MMARPATTVNAAGPGGFGLVALAVMYGLAEWLAIVLARQPGQPMNLGCADAFAMAWLATLAPRRWPLPLATVAATSLAAHVLTGDDAAAELRSALWLLPAHLLPVAVGAALMRWCGVTTALLHAPRGVLTLLACGVGLPPLLGASLAAAVMPLAGAAGGAAGAAASSAASGAGQWLDAFESAALGTLAALPLALHLCLMPAAALRRWLADTRLWSAVLGTAGATLLCMGQLPFPFVYVSMTLLLFAAWIDAAGVAALSLVVAVMASVALTSGLFVPPPMRADWEEIYVYLALAAALVPALVLAASLAQVRRAHAELAAREAQLSRANAGLEQFVRLASHDMREPLNTVAQFAGLIEQDHGAQLPPEAQHWLRLVRSAAARMRLLLDDMLHFVRLEQGVVEAPAVVDLDALLARVRASLALHLSEREATLEIEPLGRVLGHPTLLELLFQNLVSNALKFVAPGEKPRVAITAEGAGDWRRVRVADNGIGIAAQDLAKLFLPFARLHTRRHYDGTGLGLALCRRIAQAHGGEIVVDSEPGRGSCFTVTLRAVPAVAGSAVLR